jgi:hypothetical protein
MIGFLVGYESGNIYRIYHPKTKEFKVSRDVIFSENQFFGSRYVTNEDRNHALDTLDDRSEIDMEIRIDNDGSKAAREPQDENPTMTLHRLSTMKSLFNHYQHHKGQLRSTCLFKGHLRVT